MIMRAAAVVLLVASACLSPSTGALIDGSKKAKKERPPAKNKIWDKLMRCVPAPPSPRNGTLEGGRFAYMVVVGPISRSKPRYGLWLYPILALRHALQRRGSTADLLVLCAVEEGFEADRMLESEEALFAAQGIRWRYVPKPRIRGFHMGHYKLWAWQHTEYDRVQLLDADVLPLANMDALFALPGLEDAPFVGCPGKDSVLNAGWFSLKPDCGHFKRMTDLLWYNGQRSGHPWSMDIGWGVSMPPWLNALDRPMKAGWDFFDSRGNQGHMYAYFRFFARELTLIFGDRVLAWTPKPPPGAAQDARSLQQLRNDKASHPVVLADRADADDPLARAVWANFPCPFHSGKDPALAYYHFTGSRKPWNKYDTKNPKFKEWYDTLADIGVDVRQVLFGDT